MFFSLPSTLAFLDKIQKILDPFPNFGPFSKFSSLKATFFQMGQVLGSMGWRPQELEAEPFCALLQLHDKDVPPLKTILLLLDPADLKAVRLTCKSLNEYIKKKVWANAGCKARLTEKLLTRWLKDEAMSVELTRVKELKLSIDIQKSI